DDAGEHGGTGQRRARRADVLHARAHRRVLLRSVDGRASPHRRVAMARCFGDGDPLYERYHDEEWGFPVLDERGLFERMSLEAFQSGLSWRTILRKREA